MEQDPMLQDEATRRDYQAKIMERMRDEIENTRRERRETAAQGSETMPVLIGARGFNGGISAA